MNKNIDYSILISAIWENDDNVIDDIYHYILKFNIRDDFAIIKVMNYMYRNNRIEEYLTLLKLFAQIANDSEIVYFLSFYFLMKNAPYHALICFQMIRKEEAPFYYFASKRNLKVFEKKNSQIAVMISKNRRIRGVWESDSIREQMDNLDFIESEAQKTVNEMLEYIKDNNINNINDSGISYD